MDDVIKFMGRLDNITYAGLSSKAWRCLGCGMIVRSSDETHNPAPCKECAGVVFIALKEGMKYGSS